jgi:hypothetical protein
MCAGRCWASWQQMPMCKMSVLCTCFWNCLADKKRPDLHKWRYNPSDYELMTCQYKVLFENVLTVHRGRWVGGHRLVACCARVEWTRIMHSKYICYGTEKGSEGVHPQVSSCTSCDDCVESPGLPHRDVRKDISARQETVLHIPHEDSRCCWWRRLWQDRSHKGMVRSDMSKPALIFFFFHCKSTHNKIHCQNFSC